MSRVLIFVGPSGVGKSSVVSHLRTRSCLHLVPTWTTRPPRSYEGHALADHVFVDAATFEEKEKQGHFMASASLFGLRYRYGLPHRQFWERADGVHLIMLRAMLMPEISRHFHECRIYQIEAPQQRVVHHMQQRLAEEGEIGTRLEHFSFEIAAGRQVAHRLFPNDGCPSETAAQVWRCINEDFPEVG